MLRSSFNPAPTRRKLQARARGFQATLPEQLRRAGRIVAVSLATSTQPYGLSQAARTAGESATEGDVRRVYATPSQVFAKFPEKRWAQAFWRELTQGRIARAQQIMRDHCPRFHTKEIKPFDDGAAHRANRVRGRISRRQEPVFVLQTPRDFLAYVKEEVRRVGFGKAGWAACAKALDGMRGLPQWVTRHVTSGGKKVKAPGLVVEDRNAAKPTITLTNQVDYASDILDETDKRAAVDIGLDRFAEALFREERSLARAHSLS